MPDLKCSGGMGPRGACMRRKVVGGREGERPEVKCVQSSHACTHTLPPPLPQAPAPPHTHTHVLRPEVSSEV